MHVVEHFSYIELDPRTDNISVKSHASHAKSRFLVLCLQSLTSSTLLSLEATLAFMWIMASIAPVTFEGLEVVWL